MLDYILCQNRHRSLFTDARSYSGTTLTSDHRLVTGNIRITWHKIKRKRVVGTGKFNLETLKHRKDIYQQDLKENLSALRDTYEGSPQMLWNKTKEEINKAAIKVGDATTLAKARKTPNPILEELLQKQITQRLAINDGRLKSPQQLEDLRKERNTTLRKIEKIRTQEEESKLNSIIEDINNTHESAQMFKAIKALNSTTIKSYPKVLDQDNKFTSNPNKILTITKTFYQEKLLKEEEEFINPFSGPPRPLTTPIEEEEVAKAIRKLNNNSAAGEDGIPSELLKYAPGELIQIITLCLNDIFTTNTPLESITAY